MDSGRNSAILNPKFSTGMGSPWDMAKERAALQQKSTLRAAAELGNLPSDYCALKGDYTRVSNTTGNPYIDSGPGIQDPSKIPPVGYPPVHPPSEQAVSEYLNRESVPTYVRPGYEEIPPHGNKSIPCAEGTPKQYNFLEQTPGITRENYAIPKLDIKEPTNYHMQIPRAKDFQTPGGLAQNQRLYKADYANPRLSQEGRIGVEHSMNKSLHGMTGRSWDPRQYQETPIRPELPAAGIGPALSPQGLPMSEMRPQDYPYKADTPSMPPQDKYMHPGMMTQEAPCGMPLQEYKPEEKYPEAIPQNLPPTQNYKMMERPNEYTSQQKQPEQTENMQTAPRPQSGTAPQINLSELHKAEPTFESVALKGLKRIRTTNQTYGSWIGDPFLEGKDWYRSPRFPHVKTYLTKHKEDSGSWM